MLGGRKMPVAPVTTLEHPLYLCRLWKPGASEDMASVFSGFTAEHLTFKTDEYRKGKGRLCRDIMSCRIRPFVGVTSLH